MRDHRAATGLVLVALLTGSLAACSGGTGSYCSALRDDQQRLSTLATQSGKPGKAGGRALSDTVKVLDGLREKSPDDIADDWDTLVMAMEALVDAVEGSGASPSDFAGGRKPPGVTQGHYHAVTEAATELQSTRVQQAAKSIEQHGRDVCKVDLGSGLGGVG